MIRTYFAALILAHAGLANAVVYGGSNMSYSGYPGSTCSKPSKPDRPYGTTSWDIDSYNAKVRDYNSEMRQYIECVKAYLDNANNDIRRIKEQIDEEISKAKSPY